MLPSLTLVGGTVYPAPTEGPVRDGVIVIREGKIAAVGTRDAVKIPADCETVDCSGKTITAGFWNSHVHFFERKWANAARLPAGELERQLREMFGQFGFTSVFDTGSPWENTRRIRERIEAGEAAGPRIRSTGEVLIAPGAMPPDSVLRILGDMPLRNIEVATAAEAVAGAKKMLDAGVDGVKIHLQPPAAPLPGFPMEAMAQVVKTAHEAHRPVIVHPNSTEDVRAAIAAGVDVVGHTTPRSESWDTWVAEEIRGRRVALTPTLNLWKWAMRHDRASTQDALTGAAVGQLRAWTAAGGTVLFGTDIGAIEYDPREEYRLMSQAGMGFREILAALTTAPAGYFGEREKLGKVAAGYDADLVVLDGDPSQDAMALGAVAYTIQAGRVVYRSGAVT